MIERMVDRFAAEIGMDPIEVRRKNMIEPDAFPYDNGLGWTYDSGNYPALLDRVLEMVGYVDARGRKAEARRRGKRLGVGVSCFVAVSGVGPSPRMGKEGMLGGTWESANIRLHPTGEVTIMVGSKPHGQSHETVFAQIVAEQLQIDVNRVQVLHSDTQRAPYGQGSYGSRSLSVCGPAVHIAARQIREKAIKAAAHMFEAAEEDIVYEDGKLFVAGAPDSAKTLQEIAMAVWYGWNLPPGMDPNWDITVNFDPPDFNYPSGAQAAVVEIDEVTGQVDLVRFVAVSDVGEVANAMVIDGQVQGGIAHGVGQALLERAIFDQDGHLLTDSFMDYALPRATDLPNFELDRIVSPTPHNPLGAKGAGELGAVGAAAAIGNAVCDALADLGVKHIDMPYTAEKIWRLLHEARAKNGAREQ
jgi:carbon-monoxide dehydrogenase large subunit